MQKEYFIIVIMGGSIRELEVIMPRKKVARY